MQVSKYFTGIIRFLLWSPSSRMGTHKPQPPHVCLCLHLDNKMLETANHFAWLPFVTNRRLGFSTTAGYKNNIFGLKDQYPCGIYTRPCSCWESVIGSPGDSGSDDSCFGPLSIGSQSHEPLSRLPSNLLFPAWTTSLDDVIWVYCLAYTSDTYIARHTRNCWTCTYLRGRLGKCTWWWKASTVAS